MTDERKKELSEMSDKYLKELLEVRTDEVFGIKNELARRGAVVKEISPRDYQKQAHAFASYGENAMYPALGLAEEAGEVCGKIAKFIRKHLGDEPATVENAPEIEVGGRPTTDDAQFRNDLVKELGDVLWMVAELCTVYGLFLDGVMFANIAKLEDHLSRGVIVGEGDNR